MSTLFNFPHAKVLGVVDGDTIDVEIDYGFRLHQEHRVRLAGIDAPEISARGPEGENARDWLRRLLPPGTEVRLITEKPADKYGRYLAWVAVDDSGTTVNEALIAAGHAKAYDGGARTA